MGTRTLCAMRPLPWTPARPRARHEGAIDAHVAALDAALDGPRRARADLLAEARDALWDAADAYRDQGLDRTTAERRAVADFGTVAELAPAFQAELGLAQGQRNATRLLVVLAAQPLLWDRLWRPLMSDPTVPTSPAYQHLDRFVEWLGTGAVVLALAAILLCGLGVRYLDARPLTRVVGAFVLAGSAVFTVSGMAMTLLSPAPLRTSAALAGFVVVPLGLLARSAWQGVAASGNGPERQTS